MRKPTYRHVAPLACLALATACTKGTDISAEAPRPALAAPRGPIATLPTSPAAHEPAAPRAPELDDPPGDFHLAAIVHSDGHSGVVGRLVDYGDRLVLFDDLPVAQAKADGPIVASRALARGLPKDETHSMIVHGAAGGSKGNWLVYGQMPTRGSAPDGVAYRFDGAAWQKTSRYRFSHDKGMPWLAGVYAWKDSGATVVEQEIVPAKDDVSENVAVARVFWFDAVKRSASKPVAINLSHASSTPDGHVWLVGMREEKEGLWAAHVEPDGKTTWESLPGTEACGSSIATRGLLSREGGTVAVDVESSTGECADLAGVHGFVRDASGWHRTGARPAGSELLAFDAQGRTWSAERGSLVARTSNGTVVARERMPTVDRSDPAREDSPIVQRVDAQKYDPEGSTSGEGCHDANLLVRKNGDRWLVRQCNVGNDIVAAVFRDRVTQPVVVIAAEEAR